jgi:hypothetical protein
VSLKEEKMTGTRTAEPAAPPKVEREEKRTRSTDAGLSGTGGEDSDGAGSRGMIDEKGTGGGGGSTGGADSDGAGSRGMIDEKGTGGVGGTSGSAG